MREEDASEAAASGKHSQLKLTVPQDPILLSGERSKLKKELISTEDKIFNEIQNRGAFKARPLNRKLFDEPELGRERSTQRQETTKFQEFNLTMKKSSSETP